jgi:transposase-like protein
MCNLAVMALPEKYRKRLRITNMQERLNEEIRRRERVIRIFPNDRCAWRRHELSIRDAHALTRIGKLLKIKMKPCF